jgi:D-lactate dehydrogenase
VSSTEERLAGIIGAEKVSTSLLDRVAYSCDASLYQLVPRVVVRAETIADVQEIFRWSRTERIPLTFRAAGTSLSGQAVTEHALVVVRRFEELRIEKGGELVTAGCSLRGGYVNGRLRTYHRRIGPDPASIDACTIGGIVANNASGMCCGIAQNAYHTLRAMTFVLPSGLVLSTRDIAEADRLLAEREPGVYEQLTTLRDRTRDDAELVRTIRHRTRLKNTMGYSIAAFLDFDRPADILQHLMVGSEGTLGFIAEVTLETIPEPPFATTALVGFDSLADACAAVLAFDSEGAVAIELMDDATLRAIARHARSSASVELPQHAALLVEFRFDDPALQNVVRSRLEELARKLPVRTLTVAKDDRERAALWKLRKGAMPAVGAARPDGTALINEDVAFPRDRLASATSDLKRLLTAYRFDDAVVFGHARDGNMHFAFSLDSSPRSIEHYGEFMDRLAELVVARYDGSLKAEHSTGRNMAPYLEAQWGEHATMLMRQVKQLLDPDGLLGPDVIFTRDRTIHLQNIKQLPAVHPLVDRCIECGFCERVCPSAELTLSPRQRIVVQREIVRRGGDRSARSLERDFGYAGNATCAADGMCMLACPVGINTGDYIVEHRSRSSSSSCVWNVASRNVGVWIGAVGVGLRLAQKAASVIGSTRVHRVTTWFAERLRLSSWLPTMGVPDAFPVSHCADAELIYVPSCMACFGGQSADGSSQTRALMELAERAGIGIAIASAAGKICCGHPWHSNGLDRQYRRVLQQWCEAVYAESDRGRVPVVTDSSSCLHLLRHAAERRADERLLAMRILGPVELATLIVERLGRASRTVRVLLHPTCSQSRLGHDQQAVELLRQAGCQVVVPQTAWCCGMAGDRGLRYPELPAAALRWEATEIATSDAELHASTNLPCQWQLSYRTGKRFVSLWEALHRLYR